MPTAKDLLGTWQLISLKTFSDSEEAILLGEPMGPNPLGRVTFNSSGYINVHVTGSSNITPLSTSWLAAEPEEIAKIARGFASYCGWYTVFEEEGKLSFSTQVDVSLDPSMMGTVEARTVEFKVVEGKEQMMLRPTDPFLLGVSFRLFIFEDMRGVVANSFCEKREIRLMRH